MDGCAGPGGGLVGSWRPGEPASSADAEQSTDSVGRPSIMTPSRACGDARPAIHSRGFLRCEHRRAARTQRGANPNRFTHTGARSCSISHRVFWLRQGWSHCWRERRRAWTAEVHRDGDLERSGRDGDGVSGLVSIDLTGPYSDFSTVPIVWRRGVGASIVPGAVFKGVPGVFCSSDLSVLAMTARTRRTGAI